MFNRVYISSFSLVTVICVSIIASAAVQFWEPKDDLGAEVVSFEQVCSDLLTVESLKSACPSAESKAGLRVNADTDFSETVGKCSLSISGSGAVTMHVVVDVFGDHNSAGERMAQRMHDGAGAKGNLFTNDTYGNLLGLGEVSALDIIYSGRNLLLWNDYTYAEIKPSGGGLCVGDELYELGRYIYPRMTNFDLYVP